MEKRKRENEKTAAKNKELMKTEKAKDEKTEKRNEINNESAVNEKRIGKKTAKRRNDLPSAPPKIPK